MAGQDIRHAVAAVVRDEAGMVLAVRRPDEPGEELPNIWGLPATTLEPGERPEEGVRRLGREKLAVQLEPLRVLGRGEQQRTGYTLAMTVYEASMTGEPEVQPRAERGGTQYEGIDWLPEASFYDAAARGSLCCRLFLEAMR